MYAAIVGAPARAPRSISIALLLLVHAGFWSLWAKLGWTLAQLGPGSLGVPACLALVGFGLGVRTLVLRLELRPSTSARLSLAFVVLALGWTGLAGGIEWGWATSSVAAGAVDAARVLLVLAGMCAAPAGFEVADELGAAGQRGACRAGWQAAVVAGGLAGIGGAATDLGLAAVFDRCIGLGLTSVAVAVGLAFCWTALARLARGSSDGPGPRAEGARMASASFDSGLQTHM